MQLGCNFIKLYKSVLLVNLNCHQHDQVQYKSVAYFILMCRVSEPMPMGDSEFDEMLPCEFCHDPFPYDMLFQHQVRANTE